MTQESSIFSLLNVETLRLRLQDIQKEPIQNQTSTYEGVFANLDRIASVLASDIKLSTDRLLSLNASRRVLIERRIETIARQIAGERGEKFNRQIVLTDVVRSNKNDLVTAAWNAFIIELSLYNAFEIFILKALEFHGWKTFECADLRKLNFTIHSFLNEKALNFASDKHCWNFVRNNVYSWYVPSSEAVEALSETMQLIDSTTPLSWSAEDLSRWYCHFVMKSGLRHLCGSDEKLAGNIFIDLIENHFEEKLVQKYGKNKVARKFLIPSSQKGGIAHSVLDRLFAEFDSSISLDEKDSNPDSKQIQNSLWVCEKESFELFFTEVLAILKTVSKNSSDRMITANESSKIAHVIKSTQTLALELHNIEQLSLSNETAGFVAPHPQTGTASLIQEQEFFDFALVTDCPTKAKSNAWLSALAQQLPYWKKLISSSSTLNWGELHLYLSVSKLKEKGLCLYLSHRRLEDGKDSDKLRRALLSEAKLELFAEIENGGIGNYKYLYAFRKCSDKNARDLHRAWFGNATVNVDAGAQPKLQLVAEESSAHQSEIAESGWSQLFIKGQMPFIRHLENCFPRLGNLASIEALNSIQKSDDKTKTFERFLEPTADNKNAAIFATLTDGIFVFSTNLPATEDEKKSSWIIVPHNKSDLSWILSILKSRTVRIWMQNRIALDRPASIKVSDLKQIPFIDLSRVPSEVVASEQDWLGTVNPDLKSLQTWVNDCNAETEDGKEKLKSKYLAVTSRLAGLERLVERYSPLFDLRALDTGSDSFLRLESIRHIYPERLLMPIVKAPEVRVQIIGKELTPVTSEQWLITNVFTLTQPRKSVVHISTKQGPAIKLTVATGTEKYLASQIQELKGYSWGELLTLVKYPTDVALFTAQTGEITRVIRQALNDLEIYRNLLEMISVKLFGLKDEELVILRMTH